ncbi:hypothetical protein CEXT_169221 [Caerostris extrusa]|uniref:Uncharacterized protein n=1 Tax=Caerostris extrusa TaxID=172846 RepID=A0AAV4VL37_CAEEX|nr:hypothetical protein CEXT_169221 [Caerostris extrusa]
MKEIYEWYEFLIQNLTYAKDTCHLPIHAWNRKMTNPLSGREHKQIKGKVTNLLSRTAKLIRRVSALDFPSMWVAGVNFCHRISVVNRNAKEDNTVKQPVCFAGPASLYRICLGWDTPSLENSSS